MLFQLIIHNFAIIDSLDISFYPGLNVITGETGAGKSIILHGAHLLLGGRASTEFIRAGESFLEVQSLFQEVHGAQGESSPASEEFLVRRVVYRNGPNKVYVNGRLGTVGMLQDRVPRLMSIVSQYDHEILLHEESHLDILDEYGGLLQDREKVFILHKTLEELFQRHRNMRKNSIRQAERRELLEFQLNEMLAARLEPEEDTRLESEREKMRHAQMLYAGAEGGYQRLYGEEGSVLERLSRLDQELSRMASVDADLTPFRERFRNTLMELEDMAFLLRDYAQGVVFDPKRLEKVEHRLDVLQRLKKKYGPTLEDVLERARRLQKELNGIEEQNISETALLEDIESVRASLLEAAERLSIRRKERADALARRVEEELASLNMPQLVFEVGFHPLGPESREALDCEDALVGPSGMDHVEFKMAPNPGEPLRPMNRIASGGELSRILLAVKRILAKAGSVATLIFDEVDTGIGGTTAELLGRKLKEISAYHQVLCITHLPQIACYSDHHFKVYKEVSAGRTVTRIRELDVKERVDELARMLGGSGEDEAALEYAKRMIERLRC